MIIIPSYICYIVEWAVKIMQGLGLVDPIKNAQELTMEHCHFFPKWSVLSCSRVGKVHYILAHMQSLEDPHQACQFKASISSKFTL
jgi:hypothetical protein